MSKPEIPLSERPWLSTAEAAALVGTSAKFIERARQSGALPAKYVGRLVRIRREDLDAWFDGLEDF